jgi:prepilin-type N-terminal cleavage/methylation domain-containing protein
MEVAKRQKLEVRRRKAEVQPSEFDVRYSAFGVKNPPRSGGLLAKLFRSFKAAGALWETPFPGRCGFTLIELLVVITIIVILMGLLFPAFRGVQDQAKKTQAKNDLTQIVTAVNAFYTEYGKYPIDTSGGGPAQDQMYSPNNNSLMDVLRNEIASPNNAALVVTLNPRQIAFITPSFVKEPSNPRSGVASQVTAINGVSVKVGDYVDPWGTPYVVALDGDYSGLVRVGTALSYDDLTYSNDPPPGGATAVQGGVIAGSYGRDQTKATKTPASLHFKGSDDVISWQ